MFAHTHKTAHVLYCLIKINILFHCQPHPKDSNLFYRQRNSHDVCKTAWGYKECGVPQACSNIQILFGDHSGNLSLKFQILFGDHSGNLSLKLQILFGDHSGNLSLKFQILFGDHSGNLSLKFQILFGDHNGNLSLKFQILFGDHSGNLSLKFQILFGNHSGNLSLKFQMLFGDHSGNLSLKYLAYSATLEAQVCRQLVLYYKFLPSTGNKGLVIFRACILRSELIFLLLKEVPAASSTTKNHGFTQKTSSNTLPDQRVQKSKD